jgi:hypothetical protein
MKPEAKAADQKQMKDQRTRDRPLHPLELFFIVGLMQVTFVAWLGLTALLNSPFRDIGGRK